MTLQTGLLLCRCCSLQEVMAAAAGATARVNPKVYFDIRIGQNNAGRLEFELFADVVPRTAENFRALCTGERGMGKAHKPLHFKNGIFHRIIRGFMAQGGDFTKEDGTGGESIYGAKFNDENFIKKHTTAGLLSMANAGKNTNGSQFFITFKATPHLDNKHVVFGRLVNGSDVLKKMESVQCDRNDRPLEEVYITSCGQLGVLTKEQEAAMEAAAVKKKKAAAAGSGVGDALGLGDSDEDEDGAAAASGSGGGGGSAVAASSIPKKSAAAAAAAASNDSNATDNSSSAAAAAAKPNDSAAAGSGGSGGGGGGDGVPPKPQTELEIRMAKIRERMNATRREMKRDVVAEQKRFTKGAGGKSEESQSKNADYKESAERWRTEMLANGENPDQPYLYESAGAVGERNATKANKNRNNEFGWDVFNPDAQYRHFQRRLEHVRKTESTALEEIRDADDLTYGSDSRPPEANIDHMVKELDDTAKRKQKFSRRRAFNEDADVNYINERNRVFNKKLNRYYNQYTSEIKNNIERGSAL